MVCGNRSLNWDSVVTPAVHSMVKHVNSCCRGLVELRDYQRANRRLTSPLYQVMQNLDAMRKGIQQGRAPALLRLLKAYRDREATDPRDKIYALLGIAGDLSIYRIVPDYSIPFEELYKATTLQFIMVYRSFEVLNLTFGHSKSSNLPSWTPDWRVSPQDSKKASMMSSHRKHLSGYRASGQMPFIAYRSEPNLLCINGLFFDDIAEISDVLDIEQEIDFCKTLAKWEQVIMQKQRTEKAYVGGGDWVTAYFRTMSADLINALNNEMGKSELPVDVIPIAREVFLSFRQKHGLTYKMLNNPVSSTHPDVVQAPNEEHVRRLRILQRAFQNRRLFLTKLGYLGTVPEETRLADTVHILCAAKIPMVLRSGGVTYMGRSAGGYQLVGDTYIHGIMNGEACDASKPFIMHLIY